MSYWTFESSCTVSSHSSHVDLTHSFAPLRNYLSVRLLILKNKSFSFYAKLSMKHSVTFVALSQYTGKKCKTGIKLLQFR